MTLSEICVRRPIFATMMVSACVAIGVLSFRKLGVDQFPDVEIPVVTVTTSLRGASPEEIETQVTKVIEDAVSTAAGIDEVKSSSVEGLSIVTVNFVLDRPRDEAVQDVRDRVAGALRNLPEGTDPPVVTRFDTTAVPVVTLVVSGQRDLRELTELARLRVKEPLQGVSGVGQVQMVGGRTRAFNVLLDAEALAARGLPVSAVRTAIQQQNVETPAGRVQAQGREDVLRTAARVTDATELASLVIADRQGAPVMLRDVATVEDSVEDPRSFSSLDGTPAVSVVVQKQSGSNTVEVVDAVFARLETIRAQLPPDVHISVIRDSSKFIRRSIREVEIHLVLGGLLASLAVLLFMGSLRSTFIAALAIPSSILTTFAILRALGYTLNNFTLLALTLSVGIVIDDAIVVLENIFRHIENGQSPMRAAIEATKEITLAVSATTLSLIVIFLPTAFMEGRVGRFWRSFGVTTAFAIAVSLFVALTLTPMLCSVLLKAKKHAAKRGVVARFNGLLDAVYGRLVKWSLRFRWAVVLIAIAVIASVVPLVGKIGKDFIPQDDTSDFNVALTMPEGSDLSASVATAADVESKLRRLRGVEHVFTTVGSTRGGDDVTEVTMYVQIVDLDMRKYSVFDVLGDARHVLADYPDLRPVASASGGMFGGARSGQLSFALRGPDLPTLGSLADRVMGRMRETQGIVDVDSAAAVRKPEVRVTVDRERASDLGLRAADVATSLRTLVGGEPISKIREGSEQYDVWLRLRPSDRNSLDALRALPMQARTGLTRLDAIATLSRDRGPAEISRLNRVRQIEISANLDHLPLGTAVEKARALAERELPPGYEAVFGGRAKVLAETIGGFLTALALSFLFMYMVLAAQFESLLHPVTIMLALPLALPFALLSLLIMGDTLNIYSTFGVFMLFGIVKKNGILQVDTTNRLIRAGMERNAAIIEANRIRLRPILMTTMTLICGMIPIALGKGPGAASRATMANVIIGGQAMSLLITLLIVPVAYSLFDDAGRVWRRVRARFGKPPHGPGPETETEPAPAASAPDTPSAE